MNEINYTYSIILFIYCIIGMLIFRNLIKYKRAFGTLEFSAVVLLSSIWVMLDAWIYSINDIKAIKFIYYFSEPIITLIPVITLAAIIKFWGKTDKFIYKNRKYLFFLPVLNAAVLFTNRYHNLYFKSLNINLDSKPIINLELGNYLIAYNFFEIAVFLFSAVFLLVYIKKSLFYNKYQYLFLILFLFVIASAFYIYIFEIIKIKYDISSILCASLYYFAAFWFFTYTKYTFFPDTKQFMIDSLDSMLVAVNKQGKIIEFNKLFSQNIGIEKEKLTGMLINDACKSLNGTSLSENIDQVSKIELNNKHEKKIYKINKMHIKDVNNTVLGKLYSFNDITHTENMINKLEYSSYHDNLTGLYNRNYINYFLESNDKAENLPIGIIIGDLNGLKMINDCYGHDKGDEMLKEAAGILKEELKGKNECMAGRMGGDEYCIVLLKTCREEIIQLINNINRRYKNKKYGGKAISISLGWAIKTKEEELLEDIMVLADNNMYKKKIGNVNSYHSGIMTSLSKIFKANSTESEEHCRRMQKLALKFGEYLNIQEDMLDDLSILAMFHDIGKVSIPSDILEKPGPLCSREFEMVKQHPVSGYKIAEATLNIKNVSNGILYHHERWDGTGYPKQLKGENIPFISRIISIIDAYDVMTTGRVYKKAIEKKHALEQISVYAGSQFDPVLSFKFIKMMKKDNKNNDD